MKNIIAITFSAFIALFSVGCAEPGPEPGVEPGFPATDFTGVENLTPITEFGYTSSTVVVDDEELPEEVPVFVVRDEVIGTRDLDQGGWFELGTPEFFISRDDAEGVVVSFDVRWPDLVAEGDRELAKFYVALTDADGEKTYELEFKPDLRPGEVAYNVRLIVGGETLATARTRDLGFPEADFPTTGESSEWVSFEMYFFDDDDALITINGTEVFYFNREDTYREFSGLTFTYRTGNAPKNYNILLRNLSVLPVE